MASTPPAVNHSVEFFFFPHTLNFFFGRGPGRSSSRHRPPVQAHSRDSFLADLIWQTTIITTTTTTESQKCRTSRGGLKPNNVQRARLVFQARSQSGYERGRRKTNPPLSRANRPNQSEPTELKITRGRQNCHESNHLSVSLSVVVFCCGGGGETRVLRFRRKLEVG